MTSSLIIQCGTVQYDNNNLITDKLVPIEIMTCPSLTNPYFVMYKIGFNKIIIGCGKIEFNIQIVDENLYSLETSITVSGDTLYNLDFTILSPYKIFFVTSTLVDTEYQFSKKVLTVSFDDQYDNAIIMIIMDFI